MPKDIVPAMNPKLFKAKGRRNTPTPRDIEHKENKLALNPPNLRHPMQYGILPRDFVFVQVEDLVHVQSS
jgi:hypothetical protein